MSRSPEFSPPPEVSGEYVEALSEKESVRWEVQEKDGARTISVGNQEGTRLTLEEQKDLEEVDRADVFAFQNGVPVSVSVSRDALAAAYQQLGYVLAPERVSYDPTNGDQPLRSSLKSLGEPAAKVFDQVYDPQTELFQSVESTLYSRPRLATLMSVDGRAVDVADFSLERFKQRLALRGVGVQETPVFDEQKPVLTFYGDKAEGTSFFLTDGTDFSEEVEKELPQE